MPNNGSYLTAAYIVAAVIVVGYAVVLWRASAGARDDAPGEQ
jgi:hypothetical protein